MKSIREFPSPLAKALLGIFFDIDDTFTSHGRIPAEAFQMLWKAAQSGLKMVPITGRPAGWCDHIARMWPVDAVVGENGALYFRHDDRENKIKKRFRDSDEVRAANRHRLCLVKEEILRSVPGAALASDQPYRETDLAIDYCEDVPPLSWGEVEKICEIFRSHGATCKVSSVHVNGWFGSYNKLEMTKLLTLEQWGLRLEDHKDHFMFCGDSPNDEPMFQFFPHCAGVSNILHFAQGLTHWPAYLADHEGGEGFAQIVSTILEARKT